MNTETISPRFQGFDKWNDEDILEALWQGQAGALASVRAALPLLAAAARDITNRLSVGGRLIFVGSGTSGQIAAMEAAELPATYGWPEDRLLYRTPAFRPPASGVAEDDPVHGAALMAELALSPIDAVVAIAASGTTPFTCAAAGHAFQAGALVVALFNRAECPLRGNGHHPIFLDSGVEIPAGSTRMNAGTSQKVALNLISALVMTRLGRVHDGLMIELRPDRPKFRTRAARIVATIADCPEKEAEHRLLLAGGDIKQAVLMARGVDSETAIKLLVRTDRNLREALAVINALSD